MIGQDRLHIFLGTCLAILISLLGMTPALYHLPFPLTGVWPIAGFWLAISCARLDMSIWASLCIVMVGLTQDFITEAPIGAWPLGFLAAYGFGLVANTTLAAATTALPKGLLALIGGLFVGINVLAIAGDIAGGADVIDIRLWANIFLTGGLYYLVTPVFAPTKEAVGT